MGKEVIREVETGRLLTDLSVNGSCAAMKQKVRLLASRTNALVPKKKKCLVGRRV